MADAYGDDFGENFGIDEFAEEEDEYDEFEDYDPQRVADVDIITDANEYRQHVSCARSARCVFGAGGERTPNHQPVHDQVREGPDHRDARAPDQPQRAHHDPRGRVDGRGGRKHRNGVRRVGGRLGHGHRPAHHRGEGAVPEVGALHHPALPAQRVVRGLEDRGADHRLKVGKGCAATAGRWRRPIERMRRSPYVKRGVTATRRRRPLPTHEPRRSDREERSSEPSRSCSGAVVRLVVAEASVEGVVLRRKKVANVAQRRNLEHVRTATDDLALERREQPIRREKDGTLRKLLLVVLSQAEEVLARGVGLADGASSEVDDVVAVGTDLGEEVRNASVRPVTTEDGHDVTQGVGLGDGAVDVGNDDARVRGPEVEARVHALGALQGGIDREGNPVDAHVEVERGELVRSRANGDAVGAESARTRDALGGSPLAKVRDGGAGGVGGLDPGGNHRGAQEVRNGVAGDGLVEDDPGRQERKRNLGGVVGRPVVEASDQRGVVPEGRVAVEAVPVDHVGLEELLVQGLVLGAQQVAAEAEFENLVVGAPALSTLGDAQLLPTPSNVAAGAALGGGRHFGGADGEGPGLLRRCRRRRRARRDGSAIGVGMSGPALRRRGSTLRFTQPRNAGRSALSGARRGASWCCRHAGVAAFAAHAAAALAAGVVAVVH
ncbi:DNA-directed RNA polymerase subunit I, putative [Babesia caballi]|uniref:DNA-directed RNA polymerase subunit I, putative n=1 Tax=Babesia caballi TaxID=5871 RepID=A0AAV4LZQ7_BABCB|nr:DNA-directed RNA polymerase subunit I, putative [Babesia caballi]